MEQVYGPLATIYCAAHLSVKRMSSFTISLPSPCAAAPQVRAAVTSPRATARARPIKEIGAHTPMSGRGEIGKFKTLT
jgi:hypothetical protein